MKFEFLLFCYTCICAYGNAYTVQVKTRLASTVQAGVLPVSSLATLDYCYSKLAIDNCLVVLKAASCFLAHHEQGASDTLSFLCSCLYF